MKRYETETHALAADIIATLNLPKNASKGLMGDDSEQLFMDMEWELSVELWQEIDKVNRGDIQAIDNALAELADVCSYAVGLREALIKLRGSNEDAKAEDQEMVAGWEQDNVPGS